MKRYLDKLKKNIKINKNLFVFLVVLVIVGVFAGALFSVIINENDKTLVNEYLNNFMKDIANNNLTSNTTLYNTLIGNCGFTLLIWIFGISVIGIILIIPFIFIKSFILGFSIGSIISNFKIKGIILSLIYILPHQIINILIYILVSSYSIIVSYKLINSLKNKKVFDFKKIINKYTFILIFSEITLFLSGLYETYAMTYIIKIITKLIKQ